MNGSAALEEDAALFAVGGKGEHGPTLAQGQRRDPLELG